jgi:outer membrane protein TolC
MRTILYLAAALTASAQTLKLEDVLASVERSYPPLLAALEERNIAAAEQLQAEGRFDTVLRGRWDSDNLGYYSNRRWDFGVEQPMMFQGMSVSGGYRLGEGSFAPYDGKLDTRSAGEWRSGLRVPLLRDRATDFRRGDLEKARIGRDIANLSIDQQRLAIVLGATRRYWDWVAAGRRLALAKEVLQIAENRQSLLDQSVELGQLPAIESADNRRAVLQRRGQVVEAERSLQQAGIELSLFYRDDSGKRVLPSPERLPDGFPGEVDLTETQLRSDLGSAFAQRPELGRLAAQADQTRVDAQQAVNLRMPAVDLVAGFTAESGVGPVRRGPQEFKAGLLIELPFQRRTATGRLRAAESRLEQVRHRDRFLRDQIVAEVEDAASAVRAAYQRLQVARDEVRVSRQLEDAERTRFEIGDGTLFQLNLRELAAIESMLREIAAHADYHRAYAAYRASLGTS